jgi:uncharacterized integral membrane protein
MCDSARRREREDAVDRWSKTGKNGAMSETNEHDLSPPGAGERTPPAEQRRDRVRRHRQRARLYASSVLLVVALVVIIALVAANTRQVKVSWVFGDSHTSLVWLVVVPAVAGWFAGIATAFVLRKRTRAPR